MTELENLESSIYWLSLRIEITAWLALIALILTIIACVKFIWFNKPKAQEIKVRAESLEYVIKKQVADEMIRRNLQ